MKRTCKHCGDTYTANEDENACSTPICDECFDQMENSHIEEIYDFSDADNGL
jgi:hypothetical protein